MKTLDAKEVQQVKGGVFYVSGCSYAVPSTGIPTFDFNIIDASVGLYLNNLISLTDFAFNTLVSAAYLDQYYINFEQLVITC